MGDYITTANISSLVKDLTIGDDGAITEADAEFVIDLIEGDVNGILHAMGVLTPIDQSASPRAFRFIRALTAQGVVALIQADIHALSDDTEGSRESAFWRRYERGMTQLTERGAAYLLDARNTDGEVLRNVPAAIGTQRNDPTLYVGLRELTGIVAYQNALAFSRTNRIRGSRFEGGI